MLFNLFLCFFLLLVRWWLINQLTILPTLSVSLFFRPVHYFTHTFCKFVFPSCTLYIQGPRSGTQWVCRLDPSTYSHSHLCRLSRFRDLVMFPCVSLFFLLSLYQTEPWSQSHLVQDVGFMTCSVTYDIWCLIELVGKRGWSNTCHIW